METIRLEGISINDPEQSLPYTNDLPIGSKMADLKPDIMFHIADLLVAGGSSIKRLSRINRHWEKHMELYYNPAFSVAVFNLREPSALRDFRDSIDDIKNWLMHPSRKQKLIHSFTLIIDNEVEYQAFCNLLDNELSDVRFNFFEIEPLIKFYTRQKSSLSFRDFDFHLPNSLKARHLSLVNGRTEVNFDWRSFGQALRDDLVSITIEGVGYESIPANVSFKSLRKLHTWLLFDSVIHQLNDFLQRHPKINDLSVSGYDKPPNQPPLIIDSLDNLEALSVDYLPVELESKRFWHIPLKSLTYGEVAQHVGKWTRLTNTLTRLVFKIDEESVSPAPIEYFEADHDIFNPDMFYKLENLKYFEYMEHEPSKFLDSFNSGLYDDAMPLLAELVLDTNHITKEALIRFIDNHKRLCRIEGYGKDYRLHTEEAFFEIYDTKAYKSIYLQRNAY
ncbi:hypothetical protein E3P99_04114 [Wallemia hederae]|uniref:F-box domain-containing protein n=1 Tax=Wallemia hederae TaxID=1540922 RepID=A0A4V4LS27_9BASI|nr:hypothetical protein E3P99_04114 [Wallemia hederae]